MSSSGCSSGFLCLVFVTSAFPPVWFGASESGFQVRAKHLEEVERMTCVFLPFMTTASAPLSLSDNPHVLSKTPLSRVPETTATHLTDLLVF